MTMNRASSLVMRDDHTYWLEDQRIPNVTSILSDVGIGTDWDVVDPQILAFARIRGGAVHNLTELFDLQTIAESDVDSNDIGQRVRQYIKFRSDTGFEPALIECKVLSEAHLYCGTLDRVGTLNKANVLIDIKTGQPGAAAGPQTEAYRRALEEGFGVHCSKRYALVLLPDRYELQPLIDPRDWAVFQAALLINHWKRRMNP